MIALIDYGLGNIQAFANIFKRLNIEAHPVADPGQLDGYSKIVLPGVGAFDWAMSRLEASGLREALDEQVLSGKKPVLGVCVGMQIMARSSEEGGRPGLGWIDAQVKKFDPNQSVEPMHLPHMGWNQVEPANMKVLLFKGLVHPRYYFLHSYYVECSRREEVSAISTYGFEFASAVQSRNIYGTQFHPEKSHEWGVKLLENFAKYC